MSFTLIYLEAADFENAAGTSIIHLKAFSLSELIFKYKNDKRTVITLMKSSLHMTDVKSMGETSAVP